MTPSAAQMSPSVSELAPALAELTSLLLSDERIEQLLDRVGELAIRGVTGFSSCGVTMTLDHRPRTVSATSALARAVDQVQYAAGVGPCLEALETGQRVTVTDCVTETRWSDFGPIAADLGVACVLSLPLEAAGRVVGVLNMYGDEAHECSENELEMGGYFAAQAGLVLSAAARYAEQFDLTTHLQGALVSRATIDQAIGVIIARDGCTPAEGFERLRELSQHRNVKLRLVAAETVAQAQTSPGQAAAPAARTS